MSSLASAVALADALRVLLAGQITAFTHGQVLDLLHSAVEHERAAELLGIVDRVRAGETGSLEALDEADEVEQILLRQLIVDQARLEQAWAYHTGSEDDWAYSEVRYSREQHPGTGAVEVRLLKRGGDTVLLRMPVWSLTNLLAKLGSALDHALSLPGYDLDDDPKRERLLETLERLRGTLEQRGSSD